MNGNITSLNTINNPRPQGYIVDAQRIMTMRLRLGRQASRIIKNDKFLPFFRNRQKLAEKLFAFSVDLAAKKRNPEHYLATIWKKANLKKSIEWLKKLFARKQSDEANQRERLRQEARKHEAMIGADGKPLGEGYQKFLEAKRKLMARMSVR